jgi:hypothetical protein
MATGFAVQAYRYNQIEADEDQCTEEPIYGHALHTHHHLEHLCLGKVIRQVHLDSGEYIASSNTKRFGVHSYPFFCL